MTWATDRPGTTARGYGNDHQKARRHWQALIEASGGVLCARGCGRTIRYGDRWHLDHSDDRTTYLGPSCARCNMAAAGRASQATRPSRLRELPEHPGAISHP